MKRNQGFTLVELVIVIVILGILAVTAAPKFLNLSGDAKASTLKAVKASIETANAQLYAKAIIAGQQNAATYTTVNPAVALVYGYMDDAVAPLNASLDLSATEWNVAVAPENAALSMVAGDVMIRPFNSTAITTGTAATAACVLVYRRAASAGAKPTITLATGGC